MLGLEIGVPYRRNRENIRQILKIGTKSVPAFPRPRVRAKPPVEPNRLRQWAAANAHDRNEGLRHLRMFLGLMRRRRRLAAMEDLSTKAVKLPEVLQTEFKKDPLTGYLPDLKRDF